MSNIQLTDEQIEALHGALFDEWDVHRRNGDGEEGYFAVQCEELMSALRELQQRRKDDGWIDFNESVPDKFTPVIVMYADGEKWVAIWSGEYWDDGLDSDEVINITHWQPMPPTPEQW